MCVVLEPRGDQLCTPSTGLGVLRIAAGLFFLVWYMPVRRWVGEAPPAFFNPPPISLARFFSGFPPEAVMFAADVAGRRAGLPDRRRREGAVVHNRADRIEHRRQRLRLRVRQDRPRHPPVRFLGCMAFSGWGGQLAWLPDRPHRSDAPERSLALLAVCIAFAMFSAGFEKAIFWVDLDLQTGGFLSWSIPATSISTAAICWPQWY